MPARARPLIREKLVKHDCHPKPSDSFKRRFGEEHGVELPLRARWDSNPLLFSDEGGE